jgi:predicted ArsR family transcriptional regulator
VKNVGESLGPGAAVASAVPEAAHDAPGATRNRVARSILENGASTAADLAERLDVTPAAIRRHLDTLAAEGLIAAREPRGPQRRGRGRPAKAYVLTDAGRDVFYQAYDELARSALRFLAQTAGDPAVHAFARSRLAELERRYRPAVAAAAPGDRVRALAAALSADGYAATAREIVTPGPSERGEVLGEQLCQHHCPVAHVAGEFPQLCEAETELFGRLLGTHVQRLATISHGDGVCTTYVPPPTSSDPDADPTAHSETDTTPEPRRNPE